MASSRRRALRRLGNYVNRLDRRVKRLSRRPAPRRIAERSVTTEVIDVDAVTTVELAPGSVTIEIIDEAAQDELGGIDSTVSTGPPPDPKDGDFWIDSDDNNNLKRYDESTSSWVSVRDITISVAQAAATAAQTTADGKNKVFRQTSAPTASAIGDLWFDTDDDNRIYRWDGSAWVANNLGNNAIASLSASKITAGTIDASVITVSNINAGNITTGTIASGRIVAASIAAGVIDASKITAGTFGASVVYAGTIDAGNITTGTLTGRTVQTAASGTRIIMSAATNALSFQVGSSNVAHITPLTVAGVGYGLIMHHGATANSSAGAYPQIYVGSGNISMGITPTQMFAIGGEQLFAIVGGEAEINCDILRVNTSVISGQNRGIVYHASNLPANDLFGIAFGYQNSGSLLSFVVDNNAGVRGYITKTMISDRRLKENIVSSTLDEANKVYALNPVKFKYKSNAPTVYSGEEAFGLIADEVSSAIPKAVLGEAIVEGLVYDYATRSGDFTEEEMEMFGASDKYYFTESGVVRKTEYQEIDYTVIVPYVIAAVKDLNSRLAALEES